MAEEAYRRRTPWSVDTVLTRDRVAGGAKAVSAAIAVLLADSGGAAAYTEWLRRVLG